MSEHRCNYLSNCCDEKVLYGSELDFDETGAVGVCGHCHDYTGFHDDGHTPFDDDTYVPEHDCVFISGCCGAYPVSELDDFLTGYCGSCHDGAGFECEEYENCENNSYALLDKAKRKREQAEETHMSNTVIDDIIKHDAENVGVADAI